MGTQIIVSLPELSGTDFTNLKMSNLIRAVESRTKQKGPCFTEVALHICTLQWLPHNCPLELILFVCVCWLVLERAIKDIIAAVTLTSAINCAFVHCHCSSDTQSY